MKIIKNITTLLKLNKLLAIILLITGCATSSFKVTHHEGWLNELLTTKDRILLECENLQTDDIISYGFSIFVLDDQNTVLSIIQINRLSKSECDERLLKVGKILKNVNRIYIAGIGDLEEPRNLREPSYFFSNHGSFMNNGRVLKFYAIANERGDCFGAYSESRKPCPQGYFPLKSAN